MPDLLQHIFGWICGQNPDHTWSPGGVWLPLCQRCTGLYVGVFVAALLHLLVRPAPTNRWLWLNGGFLLFMIPFGFHWLPQGPVLRTLTGVLFGFGLVAYLWLTLGRAGNPLPAANITARRAGGIAPYWITVCITIAFVLWLGANGNSFAAYSLALLATAGALVLFGLALANVARALRGLMRCFFNRPVRVTV